MNEERDRLDDLNIEEAVGRTTPPDLMSRILSAAKQPMLDEAPTPISGAHSVPHAIRPKGRRMTAAVPRRNWQGAGIVAAFALLLTVGLVAFMIWKAPAAETNQPSTAGQPNTNQSPLRLPAEALAQEGEQRDQPANTEQLPQPKPEPKPDNSVEQPKPEPKPDDAVDQPKPEPKPDDPVEQPKPEPKPDDTVEQPKPEPKPDDTVEQPKPEPKPDDFVERPKPDDATTAEPAQSPVVVASFSAEGRGVHTFSSAHKVRTTETENWCEADSEQARGVKLDEARNLYVVYEGTQLKFHFETVALANGAQMSIDGEVAISTHTQGLQIELMNNDIYIDNQRATSTVRVTRGEFEVVIHDGAAVIESSKSKLDIFCVDGEVTANGTIISAGFVASLTSRGLSPIKAAARDAMAPATLRFAPVRHLGIEEFTTPPLGKMITGRLETRTAEQLDAKDDGHVAVDTGREAAVGFGFDGEHKTLRGEMVRVRYRATGAEKLVMQLFCPDRNDNFGIDLAPGKAGEWHILEIRLSDLRDRETHTDAPALGSGLSSFTLALDGKSDARLEVDWVELVREARFGG